MEGLSQVRRVLEVHTAAQRNLVGETEMDWYRILQVDPAAKEGDIKKQYKKLALALHPDKNKAVGAAAAFKLVAEAWETLSDKGKRTHHDINRDSFYTFCPHCRIQYRLRKKHENEKGLCGQCSEVFMLGRRHKKTLQFRVRLLRCRSGDEWRCDLLRNRLVR